MKTIEIKDLLYVRAETKVYEEKELELALLERRRIAGKYFDDNFGSELIVKYFETTDQIYENCDEGEFELGKPLKGFKSERLFDIFINDGTEMLHDINLEMKINVSKNEILAKFLDKDTSKEEVKLLAKELEAIILKMSTKENLNYAKLIK